MEQSIGVRELYDDSSILITGGTGFLGKLLISKLLISFPKIKKIYLLLRPHKGKNVVERANQLFEDVVFFKMKSEVPNFRQKIVLINGDCAEENLALSEEDRYLLIDNVNVLIHGAATVRFNEALKTSITINVAATKYIIQLAKQIKKLKSCVHISTAYCNCQHQKIDEQFYDFEHDYDDLIRLARTKDDKYFENVQSQLLGKRPNTYTFTKAAAEQIILKEGKNLPLAVIRPSIIISTMEDPIPGWVNNLYGPTGVVVQCCIGWIRVFPGVGNYVSDFVPADMVINAIIGASLETYKRYEGNWKSEESGRNLTPKIYNYVSVKRNPLTWTRFNERIHKVVREMGTEKAVLYPNGMYFQPNLFLYKLMGFFLHYIPMFFVDLYLKYSGKKVGLLKLCQKFEIVAFSLRYFTTRQWDMDDDNVKNCWESLSKADQLVFPFDITQVDWDDYLEVYTGGIKKYILKESMDPKVAQQHLRRCYVFNLILNAIIYTVFTCFVVFLLRPLLLQN